MPLKYVYMAILPPVLGLSLLPSAKALAPFSTFGNVAFAAATIYVLWYEILTLQGAPPKIRRCWGSHSPLT
jgi:hypothetical protein